MSELDVELVFVPGHTGPVGDAARRGRLDVRSAVHDLCSVALDPVPDLYLYNPTNPNPIKSPDLMEAS